MLKISTQNRQQISRLLWASGSLMLILSVWLWWHYIFADPYRVFWAMMDNNLSTPGITKQINQSSDGQSVDQYTRLAFGSQNATRSLVKISQTDESGKSNVTSESIGTLTNDYSRYIQIQSSQKDANGQPLNFKSVLGVWGKASDTDSSQASYFRQSLLNSVVVFGLLPKYIRDDLLNFSKNNHVYDADYSKAQHKTENGKQVIVFPVSINPRGYISLLQKYSSQLGLSDGQSLDPTAYQDLPPVKTEFSVDILSRQLTNIHYIATNRDEKFTDYGLRSPIEIPQQTIPLSELQNRVQTIQ